MLQGGDILTTTVVILAVLGVAVALALLARRVNLPLPVFLVIAGVGWAVLRHTVVSLPSLRFSPDLLFLAFVPPLLVSGAFDTPFGYVKRNWLPIGSLAIGLVVVTTVVVGYIAHALLPELPLSAAFVLGAIIAPPDPVAATAVARRLGIPNRLATILEGEGLINDAAALTAYRIALGAVAAGSITFASGARTFFQQAVVGIGAGLIVGWLITRVLAAINDTVLEVVLSLLLPYGAFVFAEVLGGAGVLAAVTAGFWLRSRFLHTGAARSRLSSRAVWNALVFIIQALVFTLIGLSIGELVTRGIPARELWAALAIAAAVIAVRMAWMYFSPLMTRVLIPTRLREPLPPWRHLTVLGWAGMRGVISLAAVLSVPYLLPGGAPFPGRGALVVITFVVIFCTLVLQGLSLPWVIRLLGLAQAEVIEREEQEVRAEAARAALGKIERLLGEKRLNEELARHLREPHLRVIDPERVDEERTTAFVSARSEALAAEREIVSRFWNEGRIGSEVLEQLEHEIDVEEASLGGAPPTTGPE